MTAWKTLSSKVLHKTAWLQLTEDQVLNQNGKPLTYTYLEKDPSVGIVIVNEKGEIFLQRQFIYPIKKTLWVIPGGFCDEGEDPLDSAKRELAEEAGITEATWEPLGSYYNSPGISHNIAYGFLARVDSPELNVLDEDEDLSDQTFFPAETVQSMLANGDITDGFSMIPLYKYLATRTVNNKGDV